MTRKLGVSLLRTLASLALFGASIGLLFALLPIGHEIPLQACVVTGSVILLWFPGAMYVAGAFLLPYGHTQESYASLLDWLRKTHDPIYWVSSGSAFLRKRH